MINTTSGARARNTALERIWILAKTEFKVRYYHSSRGVAWAFLNPLFQLIIYYTFFTVVFPSNVPYFALYLFLGLLIQMSFIESTYKALSLFPRYRYLLENIKINKIDLFFASLLSTLLGFLFNFIMYVIFSLFFTIHYTLNVLYFPLILFCVCLFILSVKFVLATLKLYFQDLIHVWDILTILLFYATPIFYSERIIYEKAKWYYYAYPMIGLITNARKVLIEGAPPDFILLMTNLGQCLLLFVLCFWILRQFSKRAVEIL